VGLTPNDDDDSTSQYPTDNKPSPPQSAKPTPPAKPAGKTWMSAPSDLVDDETANVAQESNYGMAPKTGWKGSSPASADAQYGMAPKADTQYGMAPKQGGGGWKGKPAAPSDLLEEDLEMEEKSSPAPSKPAPKPKPKPGKQWQEAPEADFFES